MSRATSSALRSAALAIALACGARAAASADPVWVNPTIANFGAVVSLPNATMQPSKDTDYKVVSNVTGGGGNDKVNASLERVARAVNIFTSAGVPLSRLHFVAVVHGPATQSILDNDHLQGEIRARQSQHQADRRAHGGRGQSRRLRPSARPQQVCARMGEP